jgi:hypothetical protein
MDKIKKYIPVVVGVILAVIGGLVAFGLADIEVKQTVPVAAGDTVTFTADDNAIMIQGDLKIEIEGKVIQSPDCWVLVNMDAPPTNAPVAPPTE